jgi:hypothetical protein
VPSLLRTRRSTVLGLSRLWGVGERISDGITHFCQGFSNRYARRGEFIRDLLFEPVLALQHVPESG